MLYGIKKRLEGVLSDRLFKEFEQQDLSIDTKRLFQKFGFEQFNYEPTPYFYVRDFVRHLNPKPWQIVYDLGSGYGRVVLYGAMNSPAFFKGVEIVPERVRSADLIRQRLGIQNAEFYAGNVLDFDLSDGDTFFLFNPFSTDTLARVGKKLCKIAACKKIKIATWGGPSNSYFKNENWVELVEESSKKVAKIDYFISL
jgi:SAM-dependent methyltransferase